MIIKRLKAEGFRNIKSCDIDFDNGVNMLYGNNAQGKTNAVEAMYIFARGRSFRAREDKELVKKARRVQRFMSQPFHVAEGFTGQQGIFVPLEKTVDSVEKILSGECNNIPEQYFLMSGTIDDVFAKYKKEHG